MEKKDKVETSPDEYENDPFSHHRAAPEFLFPFDVPLGRPNAPPPHWMNRSDIEINLVYKPALECSLRSPRPRAEHLASSLHFSSSPVPLSRLCSRVVWASPPRSPSDGCCS